MYLNQLNQMLFSISVKICCYFVDDGIDYKMYFLRLKSFSTVSTANATILRKSFE